MLQQSNRNAISKAKLVKFNDLSSPISLIETRRSGKPRDMIAPGPGRADLDLILAAAMRVPDHGKIAPWRFVIIDADQRDTLASLLMDAYRREKPEAGRLELESLEQFSKQAQSLVVVISCPTEGSKIPRWEQELSAGAACMTMLYAAHALGFVGCWLTGWAAYSPTVRDAFAGSDDRIAGFLFFGSPGRPLDERPRPDFNDVVRRWEGQIRG